MKLKNSTVLLVTFLCAVPSFAEKRTAGADFLNIPVGAEPASMGGAYTARASDAYASVWNPGGLGKIKTTQVGVQHLAYLETMRYNTFSLAHPLSKRHAIGFSIQNLGSGDITRTDAAGNNAGSFTGRYGAYSLAYGMAVSEKLSLGLTGKMIDARLDDVGAHAFAADAGGMYDVSEKLRLAAALTNAGSRLKFIDQEDSLPLALRLGGLYRASQSWSVSLEGVYRKTGLASLHAGVNWSPVDALTLRAGYKTDTMKELSALAGLTTGVTINVLGQNLSYAWLPLDDLGNTHYISLVFDLNNPR